MTSPVTHLFNFKTLQIFINIFLMRKKPQWYKELGPNPQCATQKFRPLAPTTEELAWSQAFAWRSWPPNLLVISQSQGHHGELSPCGLITHAWDDGWKHPELACSQALWWRLRYYDGDLTTSYWPWWPLFWQKVSICLIWFDWDQWLLFCQVQCTLYTI